MRGSRWKASRPRPRRSSRSRRRPITCRDTFSRRPNPAWVKKSAAPLSSTACCTPTARASRRRTIAVGRAPMGVAPRARALPVDPSQESQKMNARIPSPAEKPKLTDVKALRESARRHVEDGAVTEHYKGDREKVLQLLNEALATEMICVLRYRHDHFMARGMKAKVAAAEFLEHADQELGHADKLAERIVQLGGEPDFNPQTLAQRSHAEYRLGRTVEEMIPQNLVDERLAIHSYREMGGHLGAGDSTTQDILQPNLAVEAEQ